MELTYQEWIDEHLKQDVFNEQEIINFADTLYARPTETEILQDVIDLLEVDGMDLIKTDQLDSKSGGEIEILQNISASGMGLLIDALEVETGLISPLIQIDQLNDNGGGQIELLTSLYGDGMGIELENGILAAPEIQVDSFSDYGSGLMTFDGDTYFTSDNIFEGISKMGVLDKLDGEEVILIEADTQANDGTFDRNSREDLIAATGTIQGDAYQLSNKLNRISSGALNTGVKLPPALSGRKVDILNGTATNKQVYAGDGDSLEDIDGTPQTSKVAIPNSVYECMCFDDGVWVLFRNK